MFCFPSQQNAPLNQAFGSSCAHCEETRQYIQMMMNRCVRTNKRPTRLSLTQSKKTSKKLFRIQVLESCLRVSKINQDNQKEATQQSFGATLSLTRPRASSAQFQLIFEDLESKFMTGGWCGVVSSCLERTAQLTSDLVCLFVFFVFLVGSNLRASFPCISCST